ncbi:MAG: DUF1829 domain-containing protein [Rhodospirillaceae bacterium]
MTEIDILVDGYWRWLRDKTVLKPMKEWVEITTPYLDRHNDYIQIYARRVNGGFVLTDDGETLRDLAQSGCSLSSHKRQGLLKTTLNGFGVELRDDQLQVNAGPDTFAIRKHNLIQAMLAVNDMFILASPTVETLFFEDVATWMDLSEIRYTPRVKFSGKTGFDHMFDFAIPKSRQQPERLVRAINHPNRDAAQGFILAWLDTKDVRPENAVPFAIMNDNDRAIPTNVSDALVAYGIRPVPWSQRESVREPLAA